MNEPALSIVVAVPYAERDGSCDGSLAESLEAIAGSVHGLADGLAYEVIVVAADASVLSGAPLTPPFSAHTSTLVAPRAALTPVMWGIGLGAARGRVVAFTTTHMRVSATWARALIDEINRGVDAGVIGAGGPIALGTDASAPEADAAVLVRFSAFLPGRWTRVTTTGDIPGDNAAYLRAHLVEHEDLLRDGFWEVEFHRRFARAGKQLLMVPAALATAADAVDVRTLRAQRYAHATSFGMSRVSRHGQSALRLLLSAPLVPMVLLWRIVRRARAAGVERARLRRALPAVLRLTTAWAAGEAVGAYRAATGHGNQVTFAHE